MFTVDKINPLNVLQYREVKTPPPYFTYYTFTNKITTHQANNLRQWIYKNLKNRFYFDETMILIDSQISFCVQIGFEEAKEHMFFLLACPHLKSIS
jgi:hypothetical protein